MAGSGAVGFRESGVELLGAFRSLSAGRGRPLRARTDDAWDAAGPNLLLRPTGATLSAGAAAAPSALHSPVAGRGAALRVRADDAGDAAGPKPLMPAHNRERRDVERPAPLRRQAHDVRRLAAAGKPRCACGRRTLGAALLARSRRVERRCRCSAKRTTFAAAGRGSCGARAGG